MPAEAVASADYRSISMPKVLDLPHGLEANADMARDITGNVWLTRPEAARYLGLAPKTLAQHLHDGPRYSKFFGVVRYKLADLDDWARQQMVAR